MSRQLVTGRDVQIFINEIIGKDGSFDLIRSQEKNLNAKFSDILISSHMTNTSLGVCLGSKIGLHLSLQPLTYSTSSFLDPGAIELMYKNDIYCLSLGIDWIFNSKLGHILINSILGGYDADIWNPNNCQNSVIVNLTEPATYDELFVRIKAGFSYFPPKKWNQNMKFKKIQILIDSEFEKLDLSSNLDLLIITEINSHIINSCFFKGIPLVFLNSGNFWDEFVRELHYYLSSKMKLNLVYQTVFNGVINPNGLNGI